MAKRRSKKNLINDTTMFGVCLAMVISYTHSHHILLAMFHGLLNWLYVLYYAIVHVWF